jgi:spectinomycin phosphotransferase
VRERPPHVDDAHLLAEVRRTWDTDVDAVEHLPLGFGAHHWAAYVDGSPRLFVTLDRLEPKRTAASLEAAYAGAAALHTAGLEFVLPSIAGADGSFTRPFADGALSCTPWRHGTPGGELDLAWTTEALRRLHRTTPPPGLPLWRPLVGRDFAQRTAALADRTWGPGPYADPAREAVRGHLADLAVWTARYHDLAVDVRGRTWVATHGEADEGNQLLTAEGRLLVDWESLKLAPAELDLRTLVDAGADPDDVGAERRMLELFDLEWRLSEISEFAAWCAAPHDGTADDEIAFGGLLYELERPPQAATSGG